MSVCFRLLVLPSQYIGATNIVAPIDWRYLCWQHQYQPIQICLPRGKVYSFWRIFLLLRIGLIRVERTINNYRTFSFLHVDWFGSTPTPSPISKGRDQWELRGGTLYLPIIIVIIGAANSSVADRGCLSRIPDPGSDFFPSRIPDPGSQIPDPGSELSPSRIPDPHQRI